MVKNVTGAGLRTVAHRDNYKNAHNEWQFSMNVRDFGFNRCREITGTTNAAFTCYLNYRKYEFPSQKLAI